MHKDGKWARAIIALQEKLHDWDIFTSLMLATWIRRFTLENFMLFEK